LFIFILFIFFSVKKRRVEIAKSQKQSNKVQVMLRFLGVRTVSQGVCLVGLIVCCCLPPSLVADAKICPIGDAGGVPNASCDVDTTCAIYDGRQPKCIGWSNFWCARGDFRNLKTCQCLACPAGTGQNCTPDNQCCSIADCGTNPTSTPKPKPSALSSTSRLAPHAALHVFLLSLLLILSKFHTHRF